MGSPERGPFFTELSGTRLSRPRWAGEHMARSRTGISLMRKAAAWLCGRTEESEMKKKLLATVAVAAVVGFGGVAAAQSQMGDSNKSPSATQEKSGGSMSGTQSGNKTLNPSSTESSKPSSGQAQGTEKSGKDNERLGQGREEQKGMTRGAQEEKGGMQQKGAREERGEQKNLKGAQEERGQQKNL